MPINDSILDLQTIGIYTIQAKVGDSVVSRDIYLSPKFSNIALNKQAHSSSHENVGTIAINVTDGDLKSRWGSEHSDPQWIYVDLGLSSYIGSVAIVWEDAYSSLYDIQVSDDSDNWKTTKTINGMGKTIVTDVNTTARYVRMLGRERSTTYGHSIYEFEIYGVPPMGNQPSLFGIDVSPKLGLLKEGDSIEIKAKGYDQFGNEIVINPEFSILEGEGNISAEGILIPSKYGKIVIQAKVGNQLAKSELIIEESIKLSSVEISPKSTCLIKGQILTFTNIAKDQFGANYPSESLSYTGIGQGGIINGNTFMSNTPGTYKVVIGNGSNVADTAIIVVDKLENVNLALNKPASASSFENAGTLPSFVNDGNHDTRWGSIFNDPEYIQVDLLENFVINAVNLFWDPAYATSYNIAVSTDEENWTTVYSKTNGRGGDENIEFDPAAARYVRIWCTVRNTVYGSSIAELEVFGSDFWTDPKVTYIEIVPSTLTTYVNDELQIQAKLFDQYGLPYSSSKEIIWSVNGGGSISQDGKFTASTIGDFTLTVKYGNLSENYSISVLPEKELSRIEIESPLLLLKTSENVQLLAKGYDQYGNTIEINPVWASSSGNITSAGVFSSQQPGIFDISITYNSLSSKIQVKTFEPNNENIALNKPVTSTSGQGSAAVDGNSGTRWESIFQDGPEWIKVDLGDAYHITDIEILWEEASAQDYEIQTSKDGIEWSTIKNVTGMSGERIDQWRVSGLGQYIRLYCTKRSTNYGYSAWEFKVYGFPMTDGESYRIQFVNPIQSLSIENSVQYETLVFDKKGNIIPTPSLLWSVEKLGMISQEGVFTPNQTGSTSIKASSQQVEEILPITIFSTTNTLNVKEQKTLVYPSPASTVINVQGNDIVEIQLFSQSGKLVLKTSKTEQIDISFLPKGLYLVRITERNNFSSVAKLIIN